MPGATMDLKNETLDLMAGNLVLYMALFDDSGDELSGGEEGFEYARLPVTWTPAVGGEIYPTESPLFNIPAGTQVAEWRSFSAAVEGTDYGGKELSPHRIFEGQGTLLLDKEQMGWRIT